jgi:putative phosphoserine phosphatase/1-acylglycerol-3-phosphate O-acyltransferase
MNYRSPNADTKRMMSAISALLPDELRTAHIPSEDELRRTYPPGWDPETATDDRERRPGQD